MITYGPANQTLPIGALAILPCRAASPSPVKLIWLKDGKPIPDPEETRYSLLESGSLQIHQLKREDAGQFVCQATSKDGQSVWGAHLAVEPHTDPTVIFHRMPEPSTRPSAPGKPKVGEITETTISWEWQAPNDYGATPISGYIVQYFR